VADALEPPAPGGHVGGQHLLDVGSTQVGVAHDAGQQGAGAGPLALGGGGQDELGLAHGAHRLGAVGPVPRPALDEDGRLHVVAAAGVRLQVAEEVAVEGPVPEVVVGVADGLVGVQRRLGPPLEPGVV
jgi:hypothetical protein